MLHSAAVPCGVPVPHLAGKRALVMLLMHGATHFPHRCRRSNADGAKAGSGGGSDADEDIVQRLIKLAGPLAGQLSLGTVMGVCSGYALKVVGKAGAFFVGAYALPPKIITKSDAVRGICRMHIHYNPGSRLLVSSRPIGPDCMMPMP